MTINRVQNVWFDDAATSAMGAAFDRACESLRNFGSAVPTIRGGGHCSRQEWRARFRPPL